MDGLSWQSVPRFSTSFQNFVIFSVSSGHHTLGFWTKPKKVELESKFFFAEQIAVWEFVWSCWAPRWSTKGCQRDSKDFRLCCNISVHRKQQLNVFSSTLKYQVEMMSMLFTKEVFFPWKESVIESCIKLWILHS